MQSDIRTPWLWDQYHEGMDFAARSDVLRLAAVEGEPPYKYMAELNCRGLAWTKDGPAVVTQHYVGICFPSHHLVRSSDPAQILTWLAPQTEFHPNIRGFICCVGHIAPGTTLVTLLQQIWAMVTWQRFTANERDALNREACAWARRNLDRLPIDPRRSMLALAEREPNEEPRHGGQ